MSPLAVSLIAFAVIFVGAFLGVLLRRALPGHHLDDDAKDVVRLGTGLIGTIAALVLGLIIASAKSSYDTQSSQVQYMTANFILLDQQARDIAARMGQAFDIARADRVCDRCEHDRYGVGRIQDVRHGCARIGHDDIRAERDQFG